MFKSIMKLGRLLNSVMGVAMASTAWVNRTSNKMGRIQQTFDLAIAGNGTGYTTVLNGLKVRKGGNLNQYVSFSGLPSAITGSNVDVDLYGSDKADGSDRYLLLADVITQMTADDTKITKVTDIKAYPAPFYVLGVRGDNAETGNTLIISIGGEINGSQSS